MRTPKGLRKKIKNNRSPEVTSAEIVFQHIPLVNPQPLMAPVVSDFSTKKCSMMLQHV